MKLKELKNAGRCPRLPLLLHLPEDHLELREWLRVLPKRRYVARAEWQGRQVLAKLLVGSRAGHQVRRECDGAGWLTEQGFDTPQLLATGYRADAGGWLLFDYLEDAESLADRWRAVAAQPPLSGPQKAVLGAALEAIGALHGRGLWQEDLHLDNLLCHEDRLYWVDAGSIRSVQPGQLLPAKQALANLGVFFAQLPAAFDGFIAELMAHSYQHGGDRPPLPLAALQQQVARARQRRLADYLGKVGRDCSLFSVRRGPREMRAMLRSEVDAVRPLLDDPDRYIDKGDILKAGGSSTVARVLLNERSLVVKRYNIKGFGHWLRRFWRPSRAWHSWREGHRLRFLGVATPQPLAMLERRRCWLRGSSYLVTEYLEGENLLARFASHVQGSPPQDELAALDNLFATLDREKISHGDLKGTNLIWHDGRWTLIDLDAMHQHRLRRGYLRALARDRTRFLRNWPVDSALYKLLDGKFPQATEN